MRSPQFNRKTSRISQQREISPLTSKIFIIGISVFWVRSAPHGEKKRELLRNFKNGVYDFIHSHG